VPPGIRPARCPRGGVPPAVERQLHLLTYVEPHIGLSPLQVFTVASIVSVAPVQPYLFRNYQYPEPPTGYNPGGYHFRRMGSCKHGLWQSVRASSAAPYYLEDYGTKP
jgi:hypothetical protein